MISTRTETNSTLLRAIALLEHVATAGQAISTAELIKLSQLPKPTVHRLVHQLEQEGLLQREPASKRLIPGYRLVSMTHQVIRDSALNAPRKAVLQALSQELQETCNIAMLDGNQLVYLERVEANWPVRIQFQPGSHLPLHCTASGKLFLAYMAPELRQSLLHAAPLQPCTQQTMTDPEQLEEALAKVRQQGFSTDSEELLDGMVAIAVPIRDTQGQPCATVAVHAPTIRKSLQDLKRCTPALQQAAVKLTHIFATQQEIASVYDIII